MHENDDGGLPGGRILRPMPTPSEQKALAFVAIVILLGGAVRVLRAGSSAPPTSLEQQALARQATAADSAKLGERHRKTSRRGKSARSPRDTMPVVVGGVASGGIGIFGCATSGPVLGGGWRGGLILPTEGFAGCNLQGGLDDRTAALGPLTAGQTLTASPLPNGS